MRRSGFSFQVQMELQNVLYISYLVPVSQVRQLVPKILPLNVIEKDKVFVSLVLLRCKGAGLPFLPFPRFSYNQINIRTYVKDPDTGRNGVYFLASGVNSFFISNIKRIFNLNWQYITTRYEELEGEFNRLHNLRSTGMWCGDFTIDGHYDNEEVTSICSFNTVSAAMEYLVNPLLGFYGQQDKVRRFSIRYPEVLASTAVVDHISFPLLSMLELVEDDNLSSPDSVFIVPRAQFRIHLPPEAVKPIW